MRYRRTDDGTQEVEIGDLALVTSPLGLAAVIVAATWVITRDHRNLKQLTKIATARNVRLMNHGRPLLP